MFTRHHPADYNRMMDEARARAVQLRREAGDAFWRDIADAVRQVLRSAQRFAAGTLQAK